MLAGNAAVVGTVAVINLLDIMCYVQNALARWGKRGGHGGRGCRRAPVVRQYLEHGCWRLAVLIALVQVLWRGCPTAWAQGAPPRGDAPPGEITTVDTVRRRLRDLMV
jgi:hypothetical protein